MRYKSIIEKFCRDNSGIVKMIKTIFLFGFLVVFVLFVLLLQNSNLNIEESIFNSINIVSKLILLIVAINFIIRRKNGKWYNDIKIDIIWIERNSSWSTNVLLYELKYGKAKLEWYNFFYWGTCWYSWIPSLLVLI